MSTTLKNRLIQEEGLRLRPYQDSNGIWTIGVGHNIEADAMMFPLLGPLIETGITKERAFELLDSDIAEATRELERVYPWIKNLDEPRREVLIDMCFNLGIAKLFQFHNTIRMIEEGRYVDAADNLRSSLWYRQVGNRAEHLCQILITGEIT